VVGGGGKIPGYTKKLAEKLGIVQERVAIRGEEVMQNIVFENDDAVKDSMMVTPIGIALSFYEQSNNFIFVDFNGEKLKLYDNGRLTVADAAMQMSFSNEDLFPKRGKPITFTVNGKPRMVRGMQGEAAVITVNDEISDMYRQIRSGDMINIKPSSAGEDARQELGKISELSDQLHVTVNGKKIDLPKTAEVNGTIENEFYLIKDGDEVNVHNYYTVKEIAAILDVENKGAIEVNGSPANENTRVYDSFTVELNLEISTPEYDYHTSEEDSENISDAAAEHEQTTLRQNVSEQPATEQTTSKQSAPDKTPDLTYPITVTVNGKPVTMKGKSSYVYVDVFDYIDFDLQASAGRGIVTKLNGNAAEFLKEIYNGDIIEVYWDEKK
jgi:sulfur carrier protein ThiS